MLDNPPWGWEAAPWRLATLQGPVLLPCHGRGQFTALAHHARLVCTAA